MIHYTGCSSPFGPLVIGWEADAVVSLRLASEPVPETPSCPLVLTTIRQLQEYFAGTRKEFEIPLSPQGTPFQQRVWRELCRIPYGQTRTYGEVAAQIGKPGAARAVGQAANRNPIWLLIPCHRVVGIGGTLTGYAGGLQMKQALLDLERSNL